jgi:hypothetical protein
MSFSSKSLKNWFEAQPIAWQERNIDNFLAVSLLPRTVQDHPNVRNRFEPTPLALSERTPLLPVLDPWQAVAGREAGPSRGPGRAPGVEEEVVLAPTIEEEQQAVLGPVREVRFDRDLESQSEEGDRENNLLGISLVALAIATSAGLNLGLGILLLYPDLKTRSLFFFAVVFPCSLLILGAFRIAWRVTGRIVLLS